MQPFLKHLPQYDNEDFYQIGFITLWKVLKRAAVEPSIIDNFTNYFIVSLKNAYAAEFKKFIMSDVQIAMAWECDSDRNSSAIPTPSQPNPFFQSLM